MSETASRQITRALPPPPLDLSGPASITLPILADALRLLAERMVLIRDISCDLVIQPDGACALHFRACS